VRALAADYCDRGVVFEDLVQEGTLTSSACRPRAASSGTSLARRPGELRVTTYPTIASGA
jgi:hypothetical protein